MGRGGGPGGFSSRGAIGFRGGSSFGAAPRFGVAFGTGLRQPFVSSGHSFAGFRQPVFGSRRFHNRAFLGTVYPGYFGYYGYPAYYSGDFYGAADYDPGYDYYGSAYSAPAYSAQNDIVRQQADIDRLEDEVARLRQQRQSDDEEARSPTSPRAEKTPEPSTPTLLVFRDKHTQEVQNYAVVGGTLWIFNEQRATKLPLSWLDLDATAKANDERGVNFQIPR
ncbi:MAG: hypothetical protein ACRD20_18880 [Terriglobales bacterium]